MLDNATVGEPANNGDVRYPPLTTNREIASRAADFRRPWLAMGDQVKS